MSEIIDQNSNTVYCPKICIIGAGFSGLCAGIRLKNDLNFYNFDIFEMNEEVGGAWYSNTYPGCACDVPIHAYCYTFEKRSDWSRQYAGQEEILSYLKQVAVKYNLRSKIKFSHCIKRLSWRKDILQWSILIQDITQGNTFENNYDIVINATGFLRLPKIPQEFTNFKGPIMHTAVWDHSVNLINKTVAVIGVGASAVQLIPHLSKVAKKLLVFQRTACWILPKVDLRFSSVSRWIFRNIPFTLLIYQQIIFQILESTWKIMKKDSWASKKVMRLSNWYRGRQLKNNSELYDKLTPSYDVGCKRISISSNFYPCFINSTSELITNKIQRVTHDSIITQEGENNIQMEHKIDVLVLATGYRVTDYFAPMEIFDKNEENVQTKWKNESPSLFLGITNHSLPNHFILYGPNTSTGHNSVVYTVEMQMDWIVKCIRKMRDANANVVSISKDAEEIYMKDIREKFRQMVWSASICNAWYLDHCGRNISLYPGNLKSYRKRIQNFDATNLQFEYRQSNNNSVFNSVLQINNSSEEDEFFNNKICDEIFDRELNKSVNDINHNATVVNI